MRADGPPQCELPVRSTWRSTKPAGEDGRLASGGIDAVVDLARAWRMILSEIILILRAPIAAAPAVV